MWRVYKTLPIKTEALTSIYLDIITVTYNNLSLQIRESCDTYKHLSDFLETNIFTNSPFKISNKWMLYDTFVNCNWVDTQ